MPKVSVISGIRKNGFVPLSGASKKVISKSSGRSITGGALKAYCIEESKYGKMNSSCDGEGTNLQKLRHSLKSLSLEPNSKKPTSRRKYIQL